MARQDSDHPFVGRIGDLIYYKRNGKYFVRKAGTLTKEKIKTAPEFENTRKINREFGGCVKVGHDLRIALSSLLPDHSDQDITGRLVGLFSKVIQNGKGERGSRMIEVVKNREIIKDFQFNKSLSFDKMFTEHLHFETSSKRNEVALTVNAFDPSVSFGKTSSITHFRIFLAVVAFSDFKYDKRAKAYKPVNSSIHESFVVSFSGNISLKEKSVRISITAQLPIQKPIPVSVGIIAIAGIEFCKEENGIMYALPGKNCMKIGEVF